MCFLCFCCVFCSLFAVVCVVCTPLPAFGAVSRCVVPPVLLCVSHLHRLCGCTWCFSVPPGAFFEVVLSVFLYFSPLLPLWCRVSWLLVVCWCGVLVLWSVGCCSWLLRVCVCFLFGLFGCVALSEILWCCCFVCVSRVAGVCLLLCCCCSSVGSVLFWVVRCFVVLLVLVLLLVCFVCGCSSGWLWWLCCSVRFFAPGCSCVLHRPGWFMRLVVVLFGGRSSGVALSAVLLILLLV